MLPESETGSVLLVDDDAAVRRIIKTYLLRKGIPIIDVPSGDEAWKIVSSPHSRIQLLITDLMMPGMTGVGLASLVRASGHLFPIILITGYCQEPAGPCFDMEVMAKPLDLGVLLAKVKNLIHAAPVPESTQIC